MPRVSALFVRLPRFYGTSRNAVLTQIWIALCMALPVAYLKFRSATGLSCQQILRLLDTNLFLPRNLLDLLQGKPPDPPHRYPGQAELTL
jgi:putative transposase